MIVRREASALHLYDRQRGLHCLMDEVAVPTGEAVEAARGTQGAGQAGDVRGRQGQRAR